MKKAPDFGSFAKDELLAYIDFMVGNRRSFRVEITILKEFDRFLQTRNSQIIDADCVDQFVHLKSDLVDSQYEKRQRVIRMYLDYRAIRGKGESVPIPPRPKNYGGRRIPYLYTESDISRLLSAAGDMVPKKSLRPHTFQVIIGLLYNTGLRVSEVLNLNVKDVDLENGILSIRSTKFKKSRYVPIHPTACEVLIRYAAHRKEAFPNPSCDAFFLNLRGQRVVYGSFESPFIHLTRTLGISADGRNSRVHDLRHTFAVNRLLQWYKEGADVRDQLCVLSTYMGHAHFEDTVYYLNACAELMAKGATAFQYGGAG